MRRAIIQFFSYPIGKIQGSQGFMQPQTLTQDFSLLSVTFFAWHLFGAMKSQSMTECTETIVSGTLSNAENSHHLRWKSYIRTDTATHSALLAACCCTPVMNLRCELWFNTLISTLILVWALKGCHIHISYGNCSETCMLMTGKIKRNFL